MVNYELSPEENDKVFQDVIIPYFASKKEKSDKPTFVLLVGQPGAGKTSLSTQYSKSLSQKPVLFGADDLRALHPHRNEIMQKHESQYPFLTKKDSGIRREKLVDHALENKYNILIETILTNPNDWNLGTINRAKQAGYHVECAVLGVHHHQSLLGIFSRYEEQKRLTGHGFAPTYDVHDKAYAVIPEIICNMDFYGSVDHIAIFNRNLDNFYNQPTSKNKANSNQILSAINTSRKSGLTPQELVKIQRGWENIILSMERRHAPTEEIEIVRKFYQNYKKTTNAQIFVPLWLQKNQER